VLGCPTLLLPLNPSFAACPAVVAAAASCASEAPCQPAGTPSAKSCCCVCSFSSAKRICCAKVVLQAPHLLLKHTSFAPLLCACLFKQPMLLALVVAAIGLGTLSHLSLLLLLQRHHLLDPVPVRLKLFSG
jgi:hypothetical protein